MNIALYVSKAIYPPAAKGVVSGHVQIALKTAELLIARGHRVTLITTRAPEGHSLPGFIDKSKISLVLVSSGAEEWPRHTRMNIVGAVKLFLEMHKILRKGRFDVLHFFGSNRCACLLALLKGTGVRGTSVMTFSNFRPKAGPLSRLAGRLLFAKHIRYPVSSTAYVKQQLETAGFRDVYLNRPGFLNKEDQDSPEAFMPRPGSRGFVLFWRDAEWINGADICISVFRSLSAEYRDFDFVFAVRPRHTMQKEMEDLAAQRSNVHLLLYPYGKGITIARMLRSAHCVVMPFRRLSLHPQMALLETLAAGKPLITTAVGSNSELVDDPAAILYVREDSEEETYRGVKKLLENPGMARTMGEKAHEQVMFKWNWGGYATRLKELYGRMAS